MRSNAYPLQTELAVGFGVMVSLWCGLFRFVSRDIFPDENADINGLTQCRHQAQCMNIAQAEVH